LQVARAAAKARFAHGAVGVAGVDGRDAHPAPRSAKIFFVDDQRSGCDAVGREGGCRAGRSVSSDNRKVGAAASFETGLGGAKFEAARNEKLGCICHGG
jgi:hypothetical protein